MKQKFTHFKIKDQEKANTQGPKQKELTTMEMQIFKQQIEQFRKALGEKMRDPNLAKKAAHLLSMWIAGETVCSTSSTVESKKKKKAA